MRVAALYDVHGNLPALKAVLADVERAGVDSVVFGGDLAAGPFPRETIDLARRVGGSFVLGNADVIERGWVRDQLDGDHLDFLAGFDDLLWIDVDGLGPTLFRHGSPRSVDEMVTPLTPGAVIRQMLNGIEERTVVIGHTHVQFVREVEGYRIVNAGSVGMPYEGRQGAFWALLGPGVELRRTEYDVDDAAKRIRETGLENADELAGWLMEPPSADEASLFFEQQAGR